MHLTLINRSEKSIPRKFLKAWALKLGKEKPFRTLGKKELVIAFVNPAEMKRLNKTYRGKGYATDVLSFESLEDSVVGELVICPQVIIKQAKEHGLSTREELAYMVLHGLLHLLGYDHERSESDARKMFRLQDALFEKLL